MNRQSSNRKHQWFFIACAIAFYVLAGVPINPLIIWTGMPLFIGYLLVRYATDGGSMVHRYAAWSFVVFSVGFSLLYHLAWAVDWRDIKTGSSTSALLFLFFPLYAVFLGLAGWVLGWLIGKARHRSGPSE